MLARMGILLLVLLLGGIGGARVGAQGQGASPDEGATRLTTGASLHVLEGWDDSGLVVMRAGEPPEWLQVEPASGDIVPTSAPARVTTPARVTVEVEGTRHVLLLDGEPLLSTADEWLGRPALSPDGAFLVIARGPRGNESARYGELWRYEIASAVWTRLTANDDPESSPVVAPDGAHVAYLRDGDVWITPAHMMIVETPRRGVSAPRSQSDPVMATSAPPTHIRVKHVAAENRCRPGVPDGRVDVIPFEEYVARVVPHEMPRSWEAEALRAQAIAVRTYAWRYVLSPAAPDYDVTDTTQHQYMCDTRYPESDAAVAATAGQHLSYNGALIPALFSAENASATAQNRWGHRYLAAIDDPLSFGKRRYGHGQGFSQWGAKRLAQAGWSYVQILRHYYTDAEVTPGAGGLLLDVANRPNTPFLRGAALQVEYNAAGAALVRSREWRPDGNGGLTYGPWREDREPADGWCQLYDLSAFGDLAEGQFRIEYQAQGTAALARPLPVLFLGIDRTPPALASSLSPEGAGVRLDASVGDGTSGIERVGWSLPGWQREAEGTPVGTTISDPSASGGGAMRLEPTAHAAIPIAFPAIPVDPAHYRVWFRLRSPVPVAHRRPIATLRLFDDAQDPLQRGVRYLRAADFPSDGWSWFHVDFDASAEYTARAPLIDGYAAGTVLPVVEWHGEGQLDIDRIVLATRPAMPFSGATIPVAPGTPLLVYASDAAGNVTFEGHHGATAVTPTTELAFTTTHRIYVPLVSGAPAGGIINIDGCDG